MKAAILLILLSLPAFAELNAGMLAAQSGDFLTAVAELRPLAESGVDEAQIYLGAIYFTGGKGVAADYDEAHWWLSLAAGQGYSVAQTFLGLMYQDAKGVPRDYVEAYKWLTLAAAKERKAAPLRDRLRHQMTPYQIDQAERLAEQWKPAEPGLFVPRPRVMTLPSFKIL